MEEKSIDKYLKQMEEIQESILRYADNNDDININLNNLISIFNDLKICDNKQELKLIMNLIIKISNNYCHKPDFYSKIVKILQYFQNSIKKYFSNAEIFEISKSNKRILLFFIEEKLLTFDKYIVKEIISEKYINYKYPQYFQPELQPFLRKKWFYQANKQIYKEMTKNLPENFYKLRREGENSDALYEFMRKDMVQEFISFINRANISLNSKIRPSIYETNPFLLKNQISGQLNLIEYAAFFGSIKIFNFLKINEVKLTPSLWLFAIHGKNSNIIHQLNENKVNPDESYMQCFNQSVKCYCDNLANYFLNNFLDEEKVSSSDILDYGMQHHNFSFIQSELINDCSLLKSCKYDYYSLFMLLAKNSDTDICNKKEVFFYILSNIISYYCLFNNVLNNHFNEIYNCIF